MSDKPRVLCVCTAGKDRSVALARALSDEYETRARGISEYHTGDGRPGEHLSCSDLIWSDYVICADSVHEAYVSGVRTATLECIREFRHPLVSGDLMAAPVLNSRIWIPEFHASELRGLRRLIARFQPASSFACPPNRMSIDHVRRWLRKQESRKVAS